MTQQLFDRLHTSPEVLSQFYQNYQITEFVLFDSVLQDGFRPDSNIDVLATFASDAKISLLV